MGFLSAILSLFSAKSPLNHPPEAVQYSSSMEEAADENEKANKRLKATLSELDSLNHLVTTLRKH
jgi:hypothetical protein